MAEAQLVKTPFTINKASNGVTWLSADLASTSTWQQIFQYSVPLGTGIEITPYNFFFGSYYATDGSTSITAGLTQILKKNASANEVRQIWSGPNRIFKDIGDELQRPKLAIPVALSASQLLTVEVYSLGTTLDSVVSDFFFQCMQVSEQI